MSRTSLDEFERLPSAIIVDLPLAIPLFAVSRLSASASLSTPPVGASAFRSAAGPVGETVTIAAVLLGPQRLLWKKDLELIAVSSRTGGVLGSWSSGLISGVTLVSTLVTRTNMQVTDLSFTASAQRIDCIEVGITMRHVPQPGPVDPLVDLGAAAAFSLVEFAT